MNFGNLRDVRCHSPLSIKGARIDLILKLYDINNPQVFWAAIAGTVMVFTIIGSFIKCLISHKKKSSNKTQDNPDYQLFDEFLEILPSKRESIEFIDQFNMAGWSFYSNELDDLRKFAHKWDDAEHEFLDKKLEKKKKQLLKLINQYLKLIAKETFPTHNGLQTVPPEWEIEQPKRFWQVVDKLHDLAGQIVHVHQDLVRMAKHRLKV